MAKERNKRLEYVNRNFPNGKIKRKKSRREYPRTVGQL